MDFRARREVPAEAGDRGPIGLLGRSTPATIVTILALVVVLKLARPFLVPVAFAIMISYALEPIVRFMTRFHVPRAVATTLLTLTVFGLGGAAGYGLLDDAMNAIDALPAAAQKLRRAVRDSSAEGSPIDKVAQAATEITKAATTERGVTKVQIEEPPITPLDYFHWSGTVLGFLGRASTVFLLVFFLLVAGDLYKRKIVRIAGPRFRRKRMALEILNEIDVQIGRFLLVQLFVSLSVAVTTSLVLAWVGLDQPVVWGLAAGVFTTVPYLGPLVVSIGSGLLVFVELGSLPTAFYVACVLGVIATVKGLVLLPWLSGKATRMNQVAVLAGLLFWTWVWGISGMLLAVPLMATIKAICERVPSLRPAGQLLAE